MPLQNRVYPNGTIVAANWRGDMMGNRGGKIHDPDSKTLTRRRWASKRWICCVTSFKNRQRSVMGYGYTELFFLDEVSALASGHRPCFECRRTNATLFAACWAKALSLERAPTADEMDKILHRERIAKKHRIAKRAIEDLPDGAMVGGEKEFYAIKNKQVIRYRGQGYDYPSNRLPESLALLTPPTIVAILGDGYKPDWHQSAGRACHGDT